MSTYDDLMILVAEADKAKKEYEKKRLALVAYVQKTFSADSGEEAAKTIPPKKEAPQFVLPKKSIYFNKKFITPAQLLIVQYVLQGNNTRKKLSACKGVDANNISTKMKHLTSVGLLQRRKNSYSVNRALLSNLIAQVENK